MYVISSSLYHINGRVRKSGVPKQGSGATFSVVSKTYVILVGFDHPLTEK